MTRRSWIALFLLMSVFDTIVTDAVEVDVTVSLYTIPNPVMARTPFRFVALFGNSTSLDPKDRLSCSIDAPGAGIQFFQPYTDVPITNNTFAWDAIITTCNVRLFDAAINCNVILEKGEVRAVPVSVSATRVSSGSKIEPRLELHGVDDVEARSSSTYYSGCGCFMFSEMDREFFTASNVSFHLYNMV